MTVGDSVPVTDVADDHVASAIEHLWPGAQARQNLNSKGNQRRMFKNLMWDIVYRDRYVGTIHGKTFDVAVVNPQVVADSIPGAFTDGTLVRLPGSRAKRPR